MQGQAEKHNKSAVARTGLAAGRSHRDQVAIGGEFQHGIRIDLAHQLKLLQALAMANGWRLVSFDQDFEQFEGLERLLLP